VLHALCARVALGDRRHVGERSEHPAVEDQAPRERLLPNGNGCLSRAQRRAGQQPVVGLVPRRVGAAVAGRVGGVGGRDVEQRRERGEAGLGAPRRVEIAADHEVVARLHLRPEERHQRRGLGLALVRAAREQVDAHRPQIARPRDIDPRPDEAAVVDRGVVPDARVEDGVARDDAVGELHEGLAEGGGPLAEGLGGEGLHVRVGVGAVVHLLDEHHVRREPLEDAEPLAAVVVLLGAAAQVGRGDPHPLPLGSTTRPSLGRGSARACLARRARRARRARSSSSAGAACCCSGARAAGPAEGRGVAPAAGRREREQQGEGAGGANGPGGARCAKCSGSANGAGGSQRGGGCCHCRMR
jgi:hypothetical protein